MMSTPSTGSQSQHHAGKLHVALKWGLTLASGLIASMLVIVLDNHLGP